MKKKKSLRQCRLEATENAALSRYTGLALALWMLFIGFLFFVYLR